eukprot:TRINITY_DN9742_c2_g1_i1.p2 TRINITY_DN9742_c2_g1~~TRINITY_DN9742_c2_g1_i1.p2  ORF type:complete len:308 (+),score=86.81 TRINITY_DN9742_c2_g1_i1:75-998(+)
MKMLVTVAAVCGAAAHAASPCASYDVAAARAWLAAQGCQNSTINGCPGGQTPATGCTDAAYIARALAAGGVLAVDPNSGTRADYQAFRYNGTTYNLELSTDLQKVMALAGWRAATVKPEAAGEGAIVFTSAFAHSEGGPGLPCWARGNALFDCHEPPLLYAPNCGIASDVLAGVHPQVWTCPGAPRPAPAPPTPAPAPVPQPCDHALCYPDPAAPYVCRASPTASAAALQAALDYACSYGSGVDCAPINQGGACFDLVNQTLLAHADWAFDQYYQVQCPFCIVPVAERCNFNGAAALVKGPVPCPTA